MTRCNPIPTAITFSAAVTLSYSNRFNLIHILHTLSFHFLIAE